MKCPPLYVASLALLIGATPALADPSVAVSPRQVIPGDPVLVTVQGAVKAPSGTADGEPLHFFRARERGTYQAVFGVPPDRAPGDLEVTIEGAPEPAAIRVSEHTFPEASVVVEEELANPAAEDRKRIDADNAAIVGALDKSADEPRFWRPFRMPVAGKMTSAFGEWRTFNDGHRSQHLGIDQAAREGAPVRAINDGVVVLVRSCFLAGNVVVIDHGAGIGSAYFHLSKPSAAEGDKVGRGDVIGRAGSTGRTTGPHVHVSIHVPGTFVDPPHFLRLRLRPPTRAHAAPKQARREPLQRSGSPAAPKQARREPLQRFDSLELNPPAPAVAPGDAGDSFHPDPGVDEGGLRARSVRRCRARPAAGAHRPRASRCRARLRQGRPARARWRRRPGP